MIYGIQNDIIIMKLSSDEFSLGEYKQMVPQDIRLIKGPEWWEVGWKVEHNHAIPPIQEGYAWDSIDHTYYPHDKYRLILHQRTSDNTLQALRKIRENDKSKDWEAVLLKLDEYNKAVEDTKSMPEPRVYPKLA